GAPKPGAATPRAKRANSASEGKNGRDPLRGSRPFTRPLYLFFVGLDEDFDLGSQLRSIASMRAVTELHLDLVFARLELKGGLRLRLAVVDVLLIGRYGNAHLDGVAIDDEMMMPRVLFDLSCGLEGDVFSAHLDLHSDLALFVRDAADGRAVLGRTEEDARVRSDLRKRNEPIFGRVVFSVLLGRRRLVLFGFFGGAARRERYDRQIGEDRDQREGVQLSLHHRMKHRGCGGLPQANAAE